MSGQIVIGIDNGLLGAVVAINEDFHIMDYRDTPTVNLGKKGKVKNEFATAEMGKILREMISLAIPDHHGRIGRHVMVWLEQAQAMPKQGLSSTFKTGRGFGLWEGICIGLGITYDIVHPATWTKVVLRDVRAGDPKARSMTKCQRLYPDLPLTKPRGTVLSMDGRSDAALIATYGMMTMTGRNLGAAHEQPIEKRPPPKRTSH